MQGDTVARARSRASRNPRSTFTRVYDSQNHATDDNRYFLYDRMNRQTLADGPSATGGIVSSGSE